jgi:hypothetical protein
VFEEYCVTDSVISFIADLYFVESVVLVQVSEVVPAGGMWCPGLLDPWEEICLHFAAQGGKGVCIVVMLSPEICVAETVGVI